MQIVSRTEYILQRRLVSATGIVFGQKKPGDPEITVKDHLLLILTDSPFIELYPTMVYMSMSPITMKMVAPDLPQELVDLFVLVVRDGQKGPWRQFIDCLSQHSEFMPELFREKFFEALALDEQPIESTQGA